MEPDYEENSLVRTKTFSTHDEPKICHVVRKSGVFTHGKNSHDGVGCIKTSLCLLTSPAGVEWAETALAPEKGPTPVGRTGAGQLYPPGATTHNY